MAKMMMSKSDSGMKCTCGPASFIWMILAVVVMGVGLWFLVGGLQSQWTGGSWQSVVVWYAIGFLVLGIGKMLKWKSCAHCASKM